MGAFLFPVAQRAALTIVGVVVLVLAAPVPLRLEAPSSDAEAATARAVQLDEPSEPDTNGPAFADEAYGIQIAPPAGWVRSPDSALNPLSDPPEPVQEVARFQARIGDPQLYAAPIAITSGLVADASAVISIGVARDGSDILLMDRTTRRDGELGTVAGFTVLEEETTYEGLHVLTRYLYARAGDRVLVARAATADSAWSALEPVLRDSLATFGGDPHGANAPAAAPPPPPPAPAPEPVVSVDATVEARNVILERAASLLGLRYVWGGNSTVSGMDCSAYVSWAWGVARYTTDSLWNVSFPIGKEELRPGDALNLTTGRDPAHFGHIRIFEAWANAEHTAMWAYEETPPRAVHRVVAYDARYQPVRLAGLSGAGEVRLVPGAPEPSAPVATRRPSAPTATRRPATATPRPTPRYTPRPTATGRPAATPVPAPARSADRTFAPTPSPIRTPTPTKRR